LRHQVLPVGAAHVASYAIVELEEGERAADRHVLICPLLAQSGHQPLTPSSGPTKWLHNGHSVEPIGEWVYLRKGFARLCVRCVSDWRMLRWRKDNS
jgi:hypothetical protein